MRAVMQFLDNQAMKFLLDFFPIVLFFVAYRLQDIYLATGVLMAATVVQSLILYALERKLSIMQKATLGLILAFGSLTLALHDDRFIKWKPTVLYLAMAMVLGLAQAFWDRNFLKIMLGTQLPLPPAVWRRLTHIWVIYFVFMAVSNGVVAALFSTDAWVNFKIWGYVFPVSFILGQGVYIAKYLQPSDDSQPKA